jgi:hypothetical protein
MVHALKEIWRVLKLAGFAIDLRPISVDTPLLILTGSGWVPAGRPDQSPERGLDIAADKSMQVVVNQGLFARVRQKYFETNYYWNSLEDFQRDIDERWKDEIIISNETWQNARILFNDGNGDNRIRFPFRKKITLYQKMPVNK